MYFFSYFQGSIRTFLLRLTCNVMLIIRISYVSDKRACLWEIVGSKEN
jgi:hypothetical protein